MASFRRALPSLARCERPSSAFSRFFRDQPGRLAQGPEEKCVLTGRLAGLCAVVISLSFQIDAPRWGGVACRGDAQKPTICQATSATALVDAKASGIRGTRSSLAKLRELWSPRRAPQFPPHPPCC